MVSTLETHLKNDTHASPLESRRHFVHETHHQIEEVFHMMVKHQGSGAMKEGNLTKAVADAMGTVFPEDFFNDIVVAHTQDITLERWNEYMKATAVVPKPAPQRLIPTP